MVESLESRTLLSTVTVNTSSVIQGDFIGAGYNTASNYNVEGDDHWAANMGQAIAESSRDGFYRVHFGITDYAPSEFTRTWDSPGMVRTVRLLKTLQDNGIKVLINFNYKTATPSWVGGGYRITDSAVLDRYANVVAEGLKHLIDTRGFTNIKMMEPTNELETNDGGEHFFFYDGRRARTGFTEITAAEAQASFEDLILALRTKFDAVANTAAVRAVQISGTGSGPRHWWHLDWALNRLRSRGQTVHDEHFYMPGSGWYERLDNAGNEINPYPAIDSTNWSDPVQYERMRAHFAAIEGRAQAYGVSDMIAGEWGTTFVGALTEPTGNRYVGSDGNLLPIVDADIAMAMVNARYNAMAKWHLHDLTYENGTAKYYHGAYKNADGNWEARREAIGYGLFNRYLRGNADVFSTSTGGDANLRSVALKNDDGSYTVIVNNRNSATTPVTVQFSGTNLPTTGTFRKYVFDQNTAWNRFGDLPAQAGTLPLSSSMLTDSVTANTLVVYTTEGDSTGPAAVTKLVANGGQLNWDKSSSTDALYYRVYRGTSSGFTPSTSNQIASTLALAYEDTGFTAGSFYKVIAVDRFGNAGSASSAAAAYSVSAQRRWRFDGNTNDSTGTSNGFNSGVEFNTGHLGQGGYFDGNDSVNVGSINTGNQFTLSGWVYVNRDASSIQTIMANSGGGASNGFRLQVNTWNTTDGRVLLETGNGSVQDNAMTNAGVVPVGQWTHVAAVVDRTAGTARLYVNGVDQTSDQTIRNDFNTTATTYLGQFSDTAFRLKGKLDDVRTYGSKLTTDDIRALAEVGGVTVSVGGDGTAFGGSNRVIAASGTSTIQVEDFNVGGQGVAYNDLNHVTGEPNGGSYRSGESVDLRATSDTGGGQQIGWTASGEYTKYTVNVAEAGTYTMRVRASGSGGTIRVFMGSTDITGGTMPVGATGQSSDTFSNYDRNVTLAAGNGQILRIDQLSGGFDLNWISFTRVVTTPVPVAPSNVAATAPSSTSIRVTWTDLTNETGYDVEYKAGVNGNWTSGGSGLAAGTTSRDIMGLSASTPYYVRVRGTNGGGAGAWSDGTANTTTPATTTTETLIAQSSYTVSASANNANAGSAKDGNASTRWDTGAPQTPGQYFQVNLGSPRAVSRLVLNYAGSPNDGPIGYAVYMSNSEVGITDIANRVATGTGGTGSTTITFTSNTKQYIRIVQTGSSGFMYWSIHELEVYGPAAGTGAGIGTGTLSGANAQQTVGSTVTLSTEGSNDWAHWGYSGTTMARKSGVSKISNFSMLGGTANRYTDNRTSFNWTGGSPTASVSGTNTTGVYVDGLNNGFRFTVTPGDTAEHTVKVYVGGWNSGGTLTASAPGVTSYSNASYSGTGTYYAVYTLTYRAASATDVLTLDWRMTSGSGNVTLQAVTLV
jgi:hypothetical protein